MEYGYGWEKLHDTVRHLALLDEASLRERLSVAWQYFVRLEGGERNLPRDLDERYAEIVDRVRTHDRIAELSEADLNAVAESILELYVETERRGYGRRADADEG